MDNFLIILGFVSDLIAVWSPWVLTVAGVFAVTLLATKMVRTARTNAQVRAERAARDAYRAQVIPFPTRHNAA